ncbi:unnamed protein product [Brassica oleracea var. botrytis]
MMVTAFGVNLICMHMSSHVIVFSFTYKRIVVYTSIRAGVFIIRI